MNKCLCFHIEIDDFLNIAASTWSFGVDADGENAGENLNDQQPHHMLESGLDHKGRLDHLGILFFQFKRIFNRWQTLDGPAG